MQCICKAKFTLEKAIFRMDLMLQVKIFFKECELPKKMPFGKNHKNAKTSCQILFFVLIS